MVSVVAPTAPSESIPHGRSLSAKSDPPKKLTESELDRLREQGYTTGLCQLMARNNSIHVLRIWIVDNSGSMNSDDGHRLVEKKLTGEVQLLGCTRWTELQECVNYHIQLAAILQAPTIFRMLNDPGRVNGPRQFSIAERRGPELMAQDVSVALQTLRNIRPEGVTPLAQHIREIRDILRPMEAAIQQAGSRVVIVIATDGLPSNDEGYGGQEAQQELIQALRSLAGLPVWIVVRLCTDDKKVMKFYNDLDSELELSLDVLDDFVGEAVEVQKLNGWLNYSLSLHRMREMGVYSRLLDFLDERRLTMDEMREFMLLIFGEENFDGVASPQSDWEDFVQAIQKMQQREKMQWNPITKQLAPWIDVKKLTQTYHADSSSCNIS